MKKILFFIIVLGYFIITQANEYQISDLTLSGTKSYWVYDHADQGRKSFEKALGLPNIAPHEQSYIYLFLGRIALENDDIDEAEKYFNESVRLYSNPYPALILSNYYYCKDSLERAIFYFNEGLQWYETRITQLLAGNFDASNINFWSTRSALDGSLDDYCKYGIMYDTTEPDKLRLWTYLQYCLEQIDNLKELGEKHNFIVSSDGAFYNMPEIYPKENPLFEEDKIVPLKEQTSRFFFKKSVWSGEIICKLTLYNDDNGNLYTLWYETRQERNDQLKIDTKLALQGKIDNDGNCFFLGANEQYYPLSLMKKVDNKVILTFYYKLKFPSWGLYDREELLSQEVIFEVN